MSINHYDDFESLAVSVRARLGIPFDERPDPLDLLRRARFAGLISDYQFVDGYELGKNYAQWDSETRIIWIRADKRAELEAGDIEASFTIVHELGHVVLGHPGRARRLGGAFQHGRHIEQDEADADRLAAAIMAPYDLAQVDQTTTPEQIGSRFHLPDRHAVLRTDVLLRMHRKQMGIKRTPPVTEVRMFDTGDYNEAGPEMMRNAMRWNSRE